MNTDDLVPEFTPLAAEVLRRVNGKGTVYPEEIRALALAIMAMQAQGMPEPALRSSNPSVFERQLAKTEQELWVNRQVRRARVSLEEALRQRAEASRLTRYPAPGVHWAHGG